MVARALRLLLVIACACGGAAQAQNYGLQYTSQPGDFIGRGQPYSATFAPSAVIVQSYGAGDGIEVSIQDAEGGWTLEIISGDGAPIAVGDYPFAESGYAAAPGHPSLRFGGHGRGCNNAYGQFHVSELVRGAGNTVEKLSVDFLQHCGGLEAPLFGTLLVNTVRAMPLPAPPIAYPSASLRLLSQPGDYVGGGSLGTATDRTLTRPDLFQLTESGRGGVQVNVGPPPPELGQSWTLAFDPPSGQSIAVGQYEMALQLNDSSHPGLNVSGDGRGCNGTEPGRFTVLEIEHGPLDTFRKLAVDFVQYCNGSASGLYGGLRYNSSLPYVPPAIARVATRVDIVGGTSEYVVAPGASLNSIRLATVDDTGNPVANQAVSLSVSCGSLAGGPSEIRLGSDGDGILGVPVWTAPGFEGSCALTARLVALPINSTSILMHVAAAPPPPAPAPIVSATGDSPGGLVALSLSSSNSSCSLSRATFIDPRTISPPIGVPRELNISGDYGFIDFVTQDCGSGQSVTFNVDVEQDLPPTAQWWKYGPTMENRTRHWYTIPATVSGKRLSFTITDGGLGDDDLTMNGSITDLGFVAVPGGKFQDLWWSGAAENGWGMSLVQHRDVLFANIFAYDAQGVATWYVMPAGTWNSDHTAYTGNLFLPKGSPFYAYDVSRFDGGASVGTLKLTFANANEATFDYTINGVTGRKNISRILFGPRDAPTDKPLGDLWWAGAAQNGWGIALLQQYSTLFALWYTYDANGKATWFVMPGGNWAAKDDYRGKIYRPEGPPWLGVPYDVSRHRTTEVGDFRVRFNTDGATFDYTVDGKSGSIPLTRIPF